MSTEGQLYIVATPIGNLGDMSPRAVDVLQTVDLILAEDTRHSAPLLHHFQIATPCKSFHEHNENQLAESVCQQIVQGKSVALISDAGTPLISDPGFPLINMAHDLNIKVVTIPGACAAIAAIAASGLAVDRFSFEGFLPHKSEARKKVFASLLHEPRTMIFYESPHRILATVKDMSEVFGGERKVVLARELTKLFETIVRTDLQGLLNFIERDENQQKGEIVIVLDGAQAVESSQDEAALERMLTLLMQELPLKKAVNIVVELTGRKKNQVYQAALSLKKDSERE